MWVICSFAPANGTHGTAVLKQLAVDVHFFGTAWRPAGVLSAELHIRSKMWMVAGSSSQS